MRALRCAALRCAVDALIRSVADCENIFAYISAI